MSNAAPSHQQEEPPPLESRPEAKKVKIIDSLWAFLVAVALVGPFALPLLWRNPRYRRSTKIWASVAVLIFTWALLHYSAVLLKYILNQALEGTL